jgi:hypothetical protein
VLRRVSFQSVVYGSDGARSKGRAEADDYKAGKMLREREMWKEGRGSGWQGEKVSNEGRRREKGEG